MRFRSMSAPTAMLLLLLAAAPALAQNPLGGFKKMFDMQILLVIAGCIIVGIMVVWGLFKFVIGATALRGRDNKDRDLGGWKPPR